jgi:immunity protein Imm1 of predicted polymorphic toxin system
MMVRAQIGISMMAFARCPEEMAVITVIFNDEHKEFSSIDELNEALARFDDEPNFDLWVSTPGGPMINMMRSGPDAFLMYLRFAEDTGFTSRSRVTRVGTTSFRLANGQVDEFPLAWCIDRELCYKAITHFCANEGEMPKWIAWHED